jgi:3-carboxy-cis,cis-muconate cycloisomerase
VTRLGDALVRTTDAIGKIATDVVLLSRPEIGEVREPDAAGRGMSSTLPQKRNPVLSVLVRAVAIEAPHLAATLHTASSLAADERPQGAWHAEWNALTTLLRRTQVAASQTAEVLAGLHVDADAMRRNVDAAGPALVAERLVGALPGLSGGSGDGGAALLETVRGALRAGAGRDDVRDLLRNGLPATVPDSALDDLLEPAAYVGAADALVDRALARYASRGMAR